MVVPACLLISEVELPANPHAEEPFLQTRFNVRIASQHKVKKHAKKDQWQQEELFSAV